MRLLNWESPVNLAQIRAMVITHAHIDHCGLIPRWAYWGWKGPIYCSSPTADLLQIMLRDAAHLQEEDARFANMTKHSAHDPALPLYTEADAEASLKMLHPVPFDEWVELSPHLSFRFVRAGHILGSAIVQLSYSNSASSRLVTFSGDLGGGHSDILRDPVQILESDFLIQESTYGDRSSPCEGRAKKLGEIVNKVISRGGTLIIPAFALGRTQDLLFSLHELKKQGAIGDFPVYLDSPMANAVTKVYLRNAEFLKFNPENNHIEEALSPPFFHGVESPDDSMMLCLSDEPKVVLSASGMLQGGRVLHHLKQKLPDKKNGVLFVGYQGQETKGRLLEEGLLTLRIHHQEIPVEAEIFKLEGYSAHADSGDILRWLKGFKKFPGRVFLNHGEVPALQALAETIRREFSAEVVIPALHEEFQL